MYQQKPVIIVTMASGIGHHQRGQGRQQRQRAERDGQRGDETDHGSSGELDAVIGVATDTDPRP